MKKFIKKEFNEFMVLMRSVPASIMTLFVLSVVLMNILANKELISVGNWLALDCGMLISWIAFFTMDLIARRFGSKASITLNIVAICINLLVAGILAIIGAIPGNWSASYTENQVVINEALDSTISGTWFVLLGSTIAFISSGIVHALTNSLTRKIFNKNTGKHYLITSYISTGIAQFIDNLIFALIVSLTFFGWNIVQCITCALTGMVMELIFEFAFGPIGYRVIKRWEKHKVGNEYITYIEENR